MDDEKFKIELLSRLDKIVSLLSASCGMSKALLDRAQTETAPRQVAGSGESDATSESRNYLIKDEMQEDYDLAIQRWKSGRSL